eukprot:8085470-Karenia_brevis.AAC.1
MCIRDSVKSVARMIGPQAAVESAGNGWATDYVRNTCVVLPPNSPTQVLGAAVGDADAAIVQL